MSNVISQIQESLQRAGDHLEESPALYSITGSTQTNSEIYFKIIKTDFISFFLKKCCFPYQKIGRWPINAKHISNL